MTATKPVFTIVPTTQQYDWGKVGLSSKVAQFAKATNVESIDESKPYAEVSGFPASALVPLLKLDVVGFSSGWVRIPSLRQP